jgi:hypothetical protein
MTLSMKGLFVTFSIKTFIIMTLSIRGLFVTFSITTFIIMTHNDTQHKGLIVTFSITTFSINDSQHNSTSSIMLSVIRLNVYLLLCWMSLCWMSLCWVSWRPLTSLVNPLMMFHFKGRLLTLPVVHNRLGWKWLTITNSPTHYSIVFIMAVKCFIKHARLGQINKTIFGLI